MPLNDVLRNPPGDPGGSRKGKRNLWIAMILGIFVAGVAFAYKIAEFLVTLNAPEAQGFADVPVTAYFFVAAGWLFLLVWCFRTGKFKNMEQAKYDMLRQEEEYERQGQ
jgi:cbb3-type cytochrome oxidase subunit 3